jgi:hypothetical protein
MNLTKIVLAGVAAGSLLAAGSAQAASTRSQGAMPVSAVSAKALHRSSAPVVRESKDVAAGAVVAGLAGAAAFGTGAYFLFKGDDNPTTSGS